MNSSSDAPRKPVVPRWAWVALVFALTLVTYAPAYRAALIWNDEDYVTKPELQSWRGLERIWFELGATQQYYPALHSAFWIEHRLWGDAPAGYHLTNVLLHAAAACLVARVLIELEVGSEWVAWLAALLFALHPICVESVAWISEQKNTLSTVFYLLSALAFLRWRGRLDSPAARPEGGTALYWLAGVLFLLAILSKSVAATLPGALLVLLWWRRGRLDWRRDVFPLLPWFAVGAADGLFTGWVEKTFIGARGADFSLSFLQRCLLAGRVAWFYLGKILWPVHLVFIYPRWEVSAAVWWQYLYPLALLAGLALLAMLAVRSRGPLAAALFFIGSLFPTLGFLSVYAFVFSYVADHWAYLPSLGVIVAAAAGWGRLMRRHPPARGALIGLAAAVLAACGVLSYRESRIYLNPEVFYRTILDRNPAAWMANNNLGIILLDEGRVQESIARLDEMLRLKPDFADGHNNMGNALLKLGQLPQAEAEYRRAIALSPEMVDARINLGNLLRDYGRPADSLAVYRDALKIAPKSAEIHHNLGIALAKLGRSQEALAEFRTALRLRPNYPQAHYDLGVALYYLGRTDEAIAEYEAAVRLKPDFADAQSNLAIELVRAHRLAEAVGHFQAVLKVRPDDVPTHYRLAIVLRSLGRTREGYAEYLEAMRLQKAAGQPPGTMPR